MNYFLVVYRLLVELENIYIYACVFKCIHTNMKLACMYKFRAIPAP